MITENTNDLDFLSFDIDKYLDWLLEKYNDFADLKYLPKYKRIQNEYIRDKFLAYTHRLRYHNKDLPVVIENLYDNKIAHWQSNIKKLDGLQLEVIAFDCVKYERTNEVKEFGFFSGLELENLVIDTTLIKYWINKKDENLSEYISDLADKFKATPLKEKDFYTKELKRLKAFEFNFLHQIIEGLFIYNLNESSKVLAFACEIDKIKQIIYLEGLLIGKAPNLPLTKHLIWKKDTNVLVTLFSELLDCGALIGTKENLKRMISLNFVDKEGKGLSQTYLSDIFKPSKHKADKETAENLRTFINQLTKIDPKLKK